MTPRYCLSRIPRGAISSAVTSAPAAHPTKVLRLTSKIGLAPCSVRGRPSCYPLRYRSSGNLAMVIARDAMPSQGICRLRGVSLSCDMATTSMRVRRRRTQEAGAPGVCQRNEPAYPLRGPTEPAPVDAGAGFFLSLWVGVPARCSRPRSATLRCTAAVMSSLGSGAPADTRRDEPRDAYVKSSPTSGSERVRRRERYLVLSFPLGKQPKPITNRWWLQLCPRAATRRLCDPCLQHRGEHRRVPRIRSESGEVVSAWRCAWSRGAIAAWRSLLTGRCSSTFQ
jgi:hypothetical protein